MPPTPVVTPNGRRIRELCRTPADIRWLAKQAGRHPSTVRAAIRGEQVSRRVIRDFAQALRVSEEDLIATAVAEPGTGADLEMAR